MKTSRLAITWLGHSTFILTTPAATRVLLDPWLRNNPACPESARKVAAVDLVLVSHGHADHFEDAESVARRTGASVVANVEICGWLERRGVRNIHPMNLGGTIRLKDIAITMVPAVHSSSSVIGRDTVYLGAAAGFVLAIDSAPVVYFAGDTALFGDMRLIREMHAPRIAVLPIGDRFTMGPDAAVKACEMLGARQVVPMHYGTFPMLTGTLARFRELVARLGIDVLELEPGQTAT